MGMGEGSEIEKQECEKECMREKDDVHEMNG